MTLNKIADWVGMGYRSVDLATYQVIGADFETNIWACHI